MEQVPHGMWLSCVDIINCIEQRCFQSSVSPPRSVTFPSLIPSHPSQVDKEKQQVTVEGGIFLSDLNVELSKHGLALAK